MMEFDSMTKQSDLLRLLFEMRCSDPNRSVSSMLKELRLRKGAQSSKQKLGRN